MQWSDGICTVNNGAVNNVAALLSAVELEKEGVDFPASFAQATYSIVKILIGFLEPDLLLLA